MQTGLYRQRQIDAADVYQRIVVEVNELLRAEVERLLMVGRASGAMTYNPASRASCVTIVRIRLPRRVRGRSARTEDGRARIVLATRKQAPSDLLPFDTEWRPAMGAQEVEVRA